MVNKKFIDSLKKDYLKKNNDRRQIISLSNIILNNSKKAIFAIHRKDLELANLKLNENEKMINQIVKNFKAERAEEEGAFMAGLEEYTEAKLFFNFVSTGKIEKIKEVNLPIESYIGGLCDFTGELVRKAVNEIIDKNLSEIKPIKNAINDVLNELIDFDITGYLRTKYDQARGNLKKIEQIDYEISLKQL
ncbi:MAG TPA: hypothetical protein PLE28_01415 [bacterium]|nr:hypothetical protein [bacterium]